MTYKQIEDSLNQFNDWDIKVISDDGRRNSQNAEEIICKKIMKDSNMYSNNKVSITPSVLYNLPFPFLG